jgi:hypothetical protein
MKPLFQVDGPNLDLGYVNLKAGADRIERELRAMLEGMWARYEPYADLDFPEGFARDLDARFWEMYLGCALLDEGHALLPVAARQRDGGQPDLCVLDGERRIWIEAIAPDDGSPGPDQIVRPVPINEGGGVIAAPVRQAQLRTTSAFWTKSQKLARYLAEGVIGHNDVRLIAISASRFGAYVPDQPMPLIMSSLFPIGALYVTLDPESGEVVNEGYAHAPHIARQGGFIPRSAFLDSQFAHVSGVIWSRLAIGNYERASRPLTFVHNPLAERPMPLRWGVWDREFEAVRDGDHWTASDILNPDLD